MTDLILSPTVLGSDLRRVTLIFYYLYRHTDLSVLGLVGEGIITFSI